MDNGETVPIYSIIKSTAKEYIEKLIDSGFVVTVYMRIMRKDMMQHIRLITRKISIRTFPKILLKKQNAL